MRGLIRRARESALMRAIAVMMTGAVGAQLIGVAFVPLITRFYGPEHFGLYGSFHALLNMLAPLAALSFPLAIILPREDRDALGLARLSLLVGAVSAGLVLLVALLWGADLTERFGHAALGGLIYLLALALLLKVMFEIVARWVLRKKLFGLAARADAAHALAQNGFMAGLGMVAASGLTLVLVSLGALAFQILYLLRGALSHHHEAARSGGGPGAQDAAAPGSQAAAAARPLMALARDYRDFALYKTPQNLVGAISYGITVPMVAIGFGPAAAGYYTLARIVLGVPGLIVGSPVSSAFTPHFNQLVLDGRPTRPLLQQATGWLLLFSLVAFGAIALFGPWGFALVFGADWDKAGIFVQWLALSHGLNLANRAALVAIQVLRLQGLYLILEIVALMVRLAALSAGIWLLGDDTATIMLLALTGAVMALGPIGLALWGAGRLDREGPAAATRF